MSHKPVVVNYSEITYILEQVMFIMFSENLENDLNHYFRKITKCMFKHNRTGESFIQEHVMAQHLFSKACKKRVELNLLHTINMAKV